MEINGISVTIETRTINGGSDVASQVVLTKDGKVLKSFDSHEINLFIGPNNREAVKALALAAKNSHGFSAEDIALAKQHAEVDAVCAHQDTMAKGMGY